MAGASASLHGQALCARGLVPIETNIIVLWRMSFMDGHQGFTSNKHAPPKSRECSVTTLQHRRQKHRCILWISNNSPEQGDIPHKRRPEVPADRQQTRVPHTRNIHTVTIYMVFFYTVTQY